MNRKWVSDILLATLVLLGSATYGYAGSDRLIMAMSAQQMDRENLVFVRFLGPDGAALESNVLKEMVIREQDCSSGRTLIIVNDYKMGYAPKNMLVGIYLYPQAWNNKSLCFNVPGLGKIEQGLNPVTNNGRSFLLKMIP